MFGKSQNISIEIVDLQNSLGKSNKESERKNQNNLKFQALYQKKRKIVRIICCLRACMRTRILKKEEEEEEVGVCMRE